MLGGIFLVVLWVAATVRCGGPFLGGAQQKEQLMRDRDAIEFRGGTIVLPDRVINDGVVRCSEGMIQSVSETQSGTSESQCEVYSLAGKILSPGFVDIHVHGGRGCDFMDGAVNAVETVCRAHLEHGTTSIFPTTTTGAVEEILAMIAACEEVRPRVSSRLHGVHLYGPYFARDKVGCHSIEGRRAPEQDDFHAYFDEGSIAIATCAAELPGAAAFYEYASQHSQLLTCGHSNASFTEMQAGFDKGVRHVDHFWCAMSSVPSLRARFNVPMQASMAEFVLMNEQMSTEVIADGQHLAPELLEFAYRMLGPGRLCLVTDCNRALDLPPGEYKFGNSLTGSLFRSDGQVGWAPDGGSLASSIQGMDHMVRHMNAVTSAQLHEVIRMASLTPAERAGVQRQVGSIEVGKFADLLVLDEQLQIQDVFVNGLSINDS